MARSYTTPDGFTLRIFSSCYLDWGLEIFGPDGESLYYNPHCIASDCVGFYFEDEDGEPLEEGIDWSDEDWQEYLECEYFAHRPSSDQMNKLNTLAMHCIVKDH